MWLPYRNGSREGIAKSVAIAILPSCRDGLRLFLLLEVIRMSTAPISLSVRGLQLAKILDKPHGHLELILKILDLENELSLRKIKQVEADEACLVLNTIPIEIAEFCDDQGQLECNPMSESVLIESLRNKIGLDIRAILDPLPEELGLYSLRVIYMVKREAIHGMIKVSVVAEH